MASLLELIYTYGIKHIGIANMMTAMLIGSSIIS